MTNFIFKSPRRLIKNSPIETENRIFRLLELILNEQRCQRADLKDCNIKLQRLMIDKHLQTQVDEYFEKDPFGSQFRTANQIKEDDEI